MVENIQSDASPRGTFLRTAQEEMLKFERREREMRRADKIERAVKLGLPIELAVEPVPHH